MQILVTNVSNAHLPLKGIGAVLCPGTQTDMCELLGEISEDEVKKRPDIARWLETGRIQLQVVHEEVESETEINEESVQPVASDEEEDEPVITDAFLEDLSAGELRKMCIDANLPTSRSKADMIETLRSNGHEPLDSDGESE
jgi:hypothetical protein